MTTYSLSNKEIEAVMSTTNPTQQTNSSPKTAAEDKLQAALHDHPNATTKELAQTAEIGKSTAAKILARWAEDGNITRTVPTNPNGQPGAALWTITSPTPDTGNDSLEIAAQTPGINANVNSRDTIHLDSTGIPSDPMPSETDSQVGDNDGNISPTPAEIRTTAGVSRLPSGALRGLVEDFLRDHPGDEFSPHTIAKALARSAGAITNALDKLIISGYAVETTTTPRRFALAERH